MIVVGAGNSADQIVVELAATAQVTLATRNPVAFALPTKPDLLAPQPWRATLITTAYAIAAVSEDVLNAPDPGISAR